MTDPLTEAERADVTYWKENGPHAPIVHDLVAIIDRLSAAPVDDRERVTTTFHERTARRHDDGKHKGDLPVMGCAYCEMEHPKGRHRTLMAEREGEVLLDGKRYRVEPTDALQVTVDDDGDPLISVREELYRLVAVSPSVDPEEG